MQMASSGLQQAWLEDLDMDDPSTVKEWEMRRTTYRVSEAAYAIKRQKLMQESPGTKEDPIYLSMFDWCYQLIRRRTPFVRSRHSASAFAPVEIRTTYNHL